MRHVLAHFQVGELEIRRMRRKAERAFGAAARPFDARAFHDVVLLQGAMPLDLLEENVDAWLDAALRPRPAVGGGGGGGGGGDPAIPLPPPPTASASAAACLLRVGGFASMCGCPDCRAP